MTQQLKNKINAFVLLLVFSLNTLAGFACSVGVDMGYNTKHHEHGRHAHGAVHHHAGDHKHMHADPVACGRKLSAPNEDCCSGQVNSFNKLDKSVAYNHLLLKAPIFSPGSFINTVICEKTKASATVHARFQFVRRSCSLDDTDIRIVIQSFQI